VPAKINISVFSNSGWAEDALDALWRDGAVVLTDAARDSQSDFRAIAGDLPSRLFAGVGAPNLLSPQAPVNGVHDELREAQSRGLYVPGSGLLPHTDGYVYGDDLPDFIFLLCEQPSILGGSNALLDGQAIIDGLRAGARDDRDLAHWLSTAAVDLSEPKDGGIAAGRAAEGPIVQFHNTRAGRMRLKWRRQINVQQVKKLGLWHPLPKSPGKQNYTSCTDVATDQYVSLWRPLPSTDEETASAMLTRMHKVDMLLQQATAEAFSRHTFSLARGEVLVVDNYRVLHARAPYTPADNSSGESERRFWRVWSWTSEGTGLPPDGSRTSHPLNEEVFQGAHLGVHDTKHASTAEL